MNEIKPGERPSPVEGQRRIGPLHVAWKAWRPGRAGWHASCALQLAPGDDAAPEGPPVTFELSPDTPLREFALHGVGDSIQGVLTLAGGASGAGGDTVLAIDVHRGGTAEQGATLCRWRVCRPCDRVAPAEGSAVFDQAGGLRLDWTITGAADANQKIILALSSGEGLHHANQALTPRLPSWRRLIRHQGGCTEIIFTERFLADGTITLDYVLHRADTPLQQLDLAVLPGRDPRPGPGPAPAEPGGGDDGIALEAPRAFASFTYPRALLPPTASQRARRFFSIANQGVFQAALAAHKAGGDRAAMRAAAQRFIAPPPGDTSTYVADIASLPDPLGRLHGPRVRAFLERHPRTLDELAEALQALLGVPAASLLAADDYGAQLERLQDSLAALLVAGAMPGRHASALVRALSVCHAAAWLAAMLARAQGEAAAPPGERDAARRLRELLQASPLLPAAIFPLPQAPVAGTVIPLGYADLKTIRQRLKGYRLGELAHVENVMRGETREDAQQRHDRSDTVQGEHEQSDADDRRQQGYGGSAAQAEGDASSPINNLKREFDSLQKLYASDGLSVTVSGGWTDTVDGPATLERQAAHYARELLDRATSRIARRMAVERRQRTHAESSMQQRRRLRNDAGGCHLVGLYHWVDEVYRAHIEHIGTRLILEYTLHAPAAAFIARSNALHGLNLAVPVPPWQAAGGVAALGSAYDLTRENYLGLARRYGAEVPSPPPSRCVISASLGADPPHPLTVLTVPDGYLAGAASVAYAWTVPPASAAPAPTPTLDVLVGAAVLKIDPAGAPNPGVLAVPGWQPCAGALPASVVAAGLNHALNVSLLCDCIDDAPVFRRWQCATYDAIMAAYRCRRQETDAVLGRFAASARGGESGRRETEHEALRQGAMQALAAPGLAVAAEAAIAGPEQAAFDLLPFFRQAVAWQELGCRYAGAANDGALADAGRAGAGDEGFAEFLRADAARLLLPVRPAYVAPMLYYLSSGGSFWCGETGLCPVIDTDMALVNEWKSLGGRPREAESGAGWDIVVATSMLMLRQDDRLPELPDNPEGEQDD